METKQKELPLYQSHKKVWALKIKGIIFDSELAREDNRDTDGTAFIIPEDENYSKFKVNAEYVCKHQPKAGGYYVRYADGYESWSPALVFEEGNTLVEPVSDNEFKYRKKPVVIEAFQMTEERRASNMDWPGWLHEAWQKDTHETGSLSPGKFPLSCNPDELQITSLEGEMLVNFDDWIIQGVKGELYPCKPDIFAATYEKV